MTAAPPGVDGLQRMLNFLSLLNEKDIHYFIEQQSPDALMVTFTLLTVRVEVEFSVDRMQFSYFRGTEDAETDEALLLDLIRQHWGE